MGATSHTLRQRHGLFDHPLLLASAVDPGERDQSDGDNGEYDQDPFASHPAILARSRSPTIAHAAMTLDAPSLSDAEIRKLVERLDRPIVLVGMMGVGKSTVGRKLATLLHLDFRDADDEIEEAAQMSVGEIFERFGEAYFRAGERRVIARLLDGGRAVIATGGGAFVQADTRELILERGIAIWLDADVDTLVDRVRRKDTRPLLRDGDPREIVARLKAEREPAYALAPIHVPSGGGPHSDAVARIVQELDQWQ